LGGQEFSEELQQTLEQLEYGQLTAADAQKNVQENATTILERASK
jgi:multiple sugar transport system substrate-binding protein